MDEAGQGDWVAEMKPIAAMEHDAAVQSMAAERYLLNELTLDERDAFEAHVFDCQECALDLRAAAAFVDEARVQLPQIVAAEVKATGGTAAARRSAFMDFWTSITRPVFAVPVFAALLLVIGFQNLVTLPELRGKADEPQLMAFATSHGPTRGGGNSVAVDRTHGAALSIDVYAATSADFASYSFDLTDPQGKRVWTGSIPTPFAKDSSADQRIVLAVPAASVVHNGAYTVAITGIGQSGERTPLERQVFNLAVAQ